MDANLVYLNSDGTFPTTISTLRAGQFVKVAVNPSTHALKVEGGNPTPSSSAPSNSTPITSAANITLTTGQRLFIQNLDTDALFVKRGSGASSSSFHYVLQGGGAADDGTGGAILIDDYIGVVSFAGTTVRYNAWTA